MNAEQKEASLNQRDSFGLKTGTKILTLSTTNSTIGMTVLTTGMDSTAIATNAITNGTNQIAVNCHRP